jgi:hypothetical protein
MPNIPKQQAVARIAAINPRACRSSSFRANMKLSLAIEMEEGIAATAPNSRVPMARSSSMQIFGVMLRPI